MAQGNKAEERILFLTLTEDVSLRIILFFNYHPTITRGNESKALSDLPRDMTPAARRSCKIFLGLFIEVG